MFKKKKKTKSFGVLFGNMYTCICFYYLVNVITRPSCEISDALSYFTCVISACAVIFLRSNVSAAIVCFWVKLYSVNASEIFSICVQMFGFCHNLNTSKKMLVFFFHVYPLLKNVSEVVFS